MSRYQPDLIGRRKMLGAIGVAGLASLSTSAFAAPRQRKQDEAAEPAKESVLLTYDPITQIRAKTVNFYRPARSGVLASGKRGEFEWGELEQEEVRNLLSNYSQWVTAFRFTAEGEAKAPLPLASGKLQKGTYRIVIDFLRYMTQTVTDVDGSILGRCVVGVGLRTVADVNNFTSSGEATLIALSAKASANQADGKLRFDSIGIASDDVSALMPTNVSLDESGVVQASAATAAIKGLMKDDQNTKLVPHVIAVQYEPNIDVSKRAKLIARVSQG
jgi:hypothetical protein